MSFPSGEAIEKENEKDEDKERQSINSKHAHSAVLFLFN